MIQSASITTIAPRDSFALTNPRMLWCIHGDEVYGVRRATLGMARCLSESGVTVIFAAMQGGTFAAELTRQGHQLVVLGRRRVVGLERSGLRYLHSVMRLVIDAAATSASFRKAIQTLRPQWIHIRNNNLLLSTALAAAMTSTPVYWHLPNTIRSKLPLDLQPMGYRFLCRICGVRALANSIHTARSLAGARSNTRVLYPGLDSEHFSSSADFRHFRREEFQIHPRLPVLLVMARVIPDKAQDRVIEAVIDLLNSGTQLVLFIVGGPTDSAFFQLLTHRVTSAGVSDLIRLIGPVDDPRPYYHLCDIVINSRTKAEPFGLSIVEAMLMQRPVLAYAPGGPSETILDGSTGWLIHDASPAGYRQGIYRALSDVDRWQEMGAHARQRAIECFSLQQTCREYVRLLESDGLLATRQLSYSEQ